MQPSNPIHINDYDYDLPESKIPNKPLPNRDESKLLVYNQGDIATASFQSIAEYIPANALMVFNNTKVFPARLIFEKETGSAIEIFCLEAISPTITTENKTYSAQWQVMVGNLKRWKSGKLKYFSTVFNLSAEFLERSGDTCIVKFEWEHEEAFFTVLEQIAELPLPPYMNRKADEADKNRYQTVYAQHLGSVAAPTAGLHFTPAVLDSLQIKSIQTTEITLHVGAGTFKPVKTENAVEHEMHSEKFTITKEAIEKILNSEFVIPVGTTSMRLMESLYWLGVKNKISENGLQTVLNQWDAYQLPHTFSVNESLQHLLAIMQNHKLKSLQGATQIFIVPSYEFKICKAIVTNFHQPKSTLLLLVSAFIGDNWKKVYQFALANDFRFLSYGDSSLIIK